MKATVVVQDDVNRPLRIAEVELPPPTGFQVLVELTSSGVCQSQLYRMTLSRSNPEVFGHEGLGVVRAAGDGVTEVSEGDHVLVTWIPSPVQRELWAAQVPLEDGRRAHSPNVYTWGTHCLVDVAYTRRLPDPAPSAETCVIGCAVVTGAGTVVNLARPAENPRLVVIGVGGVGQSAVVGAVAAGAERIVAVDVSADRLDRAMVLGAHEAVLSTGDEDVARLREALHPGGCADVVVDCVSSPATVELGLSVLRAGAHGYGRGGTLILVGVPRQPLTVDAMSLLMTDRTITATSAGGSRQEQLDEFMTWHRDGRLPLSELVTDRFPLEAADHAVRALREGRVLGRAMLTMR